MYLPAFALLHTRLTDFVHTVNVLRVLERKKYLNVN